jgi:hypothetical protein
MPHIEERILAQGALVQLDDYQLFQEDLVP